MMKDKLTEIYKIKQLWAEGIERKDEIIYFLQIKTAELQKLFRELGVDETSSVETVWNKFLAKQQIRYEQIKQIKEKAEATENLYIQLQAIKMMIEIDTLIIKVGQELGKIFKLPEKTEFVLPPEIQKFQKEIQELEVKYLKVKKIDDSKDSLSILKQIEEDERERIKKRIEERKKLQNAIVNRERIGKPDITEKKEDRKVEDGVFKKNLPILALPTK